MSYPKIKQKAYPSAWPMRFANQQSGFLSLRARNLKKSLRRLQYQIPPQKFQIKCPKRRDLRQLKWQVFEQLRNQWGAYHFVSTE